jgi:DNA repair protein RadC
VLHAQAGSGGRSHYSAHDSGYRGLVRTWRDRGPVGPRMIADMLAKKAGEATQEIAWIVTVDLYATLVNVHEVARGARDTVEVEIPVALEAVLGDGVNYFALVHNHPSGSAMPSEDDGLLTGTMAEAASVAGLVLLDHVVLGRDREYFSFYEGQLCRIR